MPYIIPIRDLRNTAQISKLVHESDEPVIVTKNGYGDMVIMTQKMYEQYMLDSAKKALADIKNGAKTIPAEQAFNELRKKYGFKKI
jgi:prevent-host-death family protein